MQKLDEVARFTPRLMDNITTISPICRVQIEATFISFFVIQHQAQPHAYTI
jgi:hypothetical protein